MKFLVSLLLFVAKGAVVCTLLAHFLQVGIGYGRTEFLCLVEAGFGLVEFTLHEVVCTLVVLSRG